MSKLLVFLSIISKIFNNYTLSTNEAAVAYAFTPTVGTAKPSAKVDSAFVKIGLPFFIAAENEAHLSLSTPC